jgi:hypothetical protein
VKHEQMDYCNSTGNAFDFININPGGESKPVVIDDYQQAPLSQTSNEQVGGYHQQDKELLTSAGGIIADRGAKPDEKRGVNLISALIHSKVSHGLKSVPITSDTAINQYEGAAVKWSLSKMNDYFDRIAGIDFNHDVYSFTGSKLQLKAGSMSPDSQTTISSHHISKQFKRITRKSMTA